ncbi:putative membrane protein, partial [Yersinia pestis PY-66]
MYVTFWNVVIDSIFSGMVFSEMSSSCGLILFISKFTDN